MSFLSDLVQAGKDAGDSPEDIASVLDLAHADIATQADKSGDPDEVRFQTLSKVDDDRNDLIVDLRTEAMGRELVKQFPDPTDRAAFLHTYSAVKPGDPEFPSHYDEQARAINAAGEQFQERKREHGSLEFGSSLLGHYVERPMGGSKFQFLLKVPERTERVYSANPQLAPPTGEAPTVPETFLTRNVEVDRDALVKQSEEKLVTLQAELGKRQAKRDAMAADPLGLANFTVEGSRTSLDVPQVADELKKEEQLLEFRKKAPLPTLAKMELMGQLKDDEKFKDTIPDDWAEQFVARPVAKVIQGFARTAAAMTGDEEMLLEPDPIDALAPGALRNRFENKNGEAKADLLSSGIESLITYATPGALLKVAGKVLPYLGAAGKAVAVGRAMEGAAPLAGKAGFAGFGATGFGNSYANRLQLAENTADPVEAERIRRWAPFLAAADAVKEMITEKLIPGDVESLIAKGLTGSLGKRLLNAGLVAPTKEGLEEVAGVGLEQLYLGTPGTPEPQNVVEAFQGGFFGGLAFAPAAFFGKDVQPLPEQPGKFGFNGQVFTDKEQAEEARTESLARVEDILKPAGIITQEDAVAWLEDFERRAATPEEMDFADTVTALAPLLPKESGPAPVDQTGGGAANTGGDASPVGGIAPAGGVAESPLPENSVKEEISPPPPEAPAQTAPAAVGEAPAPVAAPDVQLAAISPPPSAASKAAVIEAFAPGIQYFNPDTSTPVGQVLSQYEQATGRKVVLYTAGANPENGRITDGFVVTGDPNTIYMARETRQPFLHVLGHETSHTLEAMPEYRQFVTELQRLEPEAWEKNQRSEAEFIADVVGSRFNQREFWERLQQRMNPSLFRQFVDFVRGIWDKLKTQLGVRNVSVNNVEAVDRMLGSLIQVRPAEGPIGEPVQTSQIQVEPRGRQSGFGFGPDLDLYNIVQPGSSVDGTTFAVEAGATPEEVQQRAREKFTEAGESVPEVQESSTPVLNATDAQAIADGGTGTKNAAVDALRLKYGVEGAKVITRENRQDVLNAAIAKMARYPRYQDNLINRLHAKPEVVDPVDACILMFAALDAQKESEDATTEVAELANSAQPVGDALARLGEANAKLRTLLDINDATGTLAGRALNFRRYMLQRDYSFVRMEKSFQSAANQGAALNAQQLEYVQMMNRRLMEADKRIKELEARDLEAEVQAHMVNFFGEQAKATANIKPGLSEAEFKTRLNVSRKTGTSRVSEWLKSAIKHSTVEEVDGVQLSAAAAMPPEVRAHLTVVGAAIIDEGVDTLDGFRDALVAEFGPDISPYAESTFAAAKSLRASLRDKHTAKKGKAKPSTTGAADARKDAAAATVAEGTVTDQEPPRELVKAIIQQNVEAGLKGPREVFPAALADLQPIYPDLTEDDLKRIFSNYGKATFPSKDEIKVEMAELQQIGRLEVTIADLQKGLPALRTGPQRQEATEQIRRLQKQVNELKRKTGITQRTESQLKGALDAAKTRLRNEIEDLTAFIEAGGRSPEQKTGKTPTVGDAELDDLRKRRDDLRAMLAEVEGPDVPTEAERIEATIKALKRTEELLTARLEAGPLAGPREAAPTVTSEEIEERRSYVTTLRELIQEEKDAVRPLPVPALQQLDRAQAALDRVMGILDGSRTVEPAEPSQPLSRAEEDILLQVSAARQLLADERREAAAPSKALEAAQKALARMEGIMDGSIVPEPGKVRQALTQAEEDLRLQTAAMRQALADERRAATAPQRALDAAQRTVDALEAILAGTATRKTPVPRGALTQAEEDLRSQAAAMRQLLAEEAREAGAPARQLKAAQASLERLEGLLASPPAITERTPTAPLSEAEEEVRAQILTVRGELAALRAADPSIQLALQKKQISARLGTLKAKLAAGDFVKKPKRDKPTPDADLNRLQAEYVLVQKEWHRRLFEESLKSRTLGQRTKDFIGETLKLARITELGFDFGIILRQGGRTVGRPDLFARAMAAGARSLSEVGQQKEWQQITADPQFQLALRMGVEITDPDDIVAYKREEAFQSRWLMKRWEPKPGDSTELKAAKAVVNAPLGTSRALARGQIIAIDTIRFGMWKSLCATLSRYGAPTEAEMRSYARMANASTGRGSIDAEWERGVGTLFLAYRWAKSGLEYVTLRPLWQPVLSGEATLRSTAVMTAEYARNLSGIGLFYLAWYMAHWKDDDDEWKIEWDPRSPRFAKLPFGDSTLVDPTAGMAQWVVLLSKMITAEKKAQSGKVMQLAEGPDGSKPAFGQGRLSEVASFLRYKLNPVLGAGLSVTSGRDAVGEKTSLGKEALKLVTPLVLGDVGKAVKANGFPEGYALSLMGVFGMSIQTWEEKHKENLTGADRVWLYQHALSIPQLGDSATVGDVLGDDAKDQKRRKTDVLLTDEQKKALLSESLPLVETEVAKVKSRYSTLPSDLTSEKRAERMKDFQNDLNRKVGQVRERVLRKMRKPAP